MAKRFWVRIDPFEPTLVTTAIEAGADAVVIPPDCTDAVHALGRITTIADDGDLRWGRDVRWLRLERAADITTVDPRLPTVIENRDWTIIPLENLIAQAAGNLIQSVHNADEAAVALEVMERGADGILLLTDDPAEILRTGAVVAQRHAPGLTLTPVQITAAQPVTLSDRCCIDTTSLLPPGEGLLVGDSASAQFLVHNENLASPYADPRPFRVNAGAVHAYCRLPDNRTKYLCELTTGDNLLSCDPHGTCRIVAVGRNKIERRPMLLVIAEDPEGRRVSLVVQNAETVRLTTPDGDPAPVTALNPGDSVLAYFDSSGGRHFGHAIEETIQEH